MNCMTRSIYKSLTIILAVIIISSGILCKKSWAGPYILGPDAGKLGMELYGQGEQVIQASQNIQRAIEFLRRWGLAAEADNVELWFKSGKILLDFDLSGGPKTSNASRWITLDSMTALGSTANNLQHAFQPGDPKDFESIAELAFSLVHEKVHAHQNYFYFWTDGAEAEAYGREIDRADKVLLKMQQQLEDALTRKQKERAEELLAWIAAVAHVKQTAIKAFRSEYKGYDPEDFPWDDAWERSMGDLQRKSLEKLHDIKSGKFKFSELKKFNHDLYVKHKTAEEDLIPKLIKPNKRHLFANISPVFNETVTIMKLPDLKTPGLKSLRALTDSGKFLDLLTDKLPDNISLGARVDVEGSVILPDQVIVDNMTPSAKQLSQKDQMLRSLSQGVNDGELDFHIKGDGTSTSHVELLVTNKSKNNLHVVIPKYETFLPGDSSFQVMMSTEDIMVIVPPGQTVSTELSTFCISPKGVKPPPEEGASYKLGTYPDPQLGELAGRIYELSKGFEKEKFYETVPIPEKRRRQTIAQLAIWMELGKISSRPQDKITKKSVGEEILKQADVKPESFSPEQKKSFDKGVDDIFNAANLTLKAAKTPRIPEHTTQK